MTKIAAALAAGFVAAVTAGICLAQTPEPPIYRPGLGDLMTMTVQPRHIKLAIAGREKNWAYAAYELHQLKEAFDRSARAWPQWRRNPITELMEAATAEPIEKLAAAIKSTDTAKFDEAFLQLTENCNACHESTNVGVNVIIVPDAAAHFPDQDFRVRR